MCFLRKTQRVALAFGLVVFGWAAAAQAVTFDLTYDDTFNDTLEGMIVGTGSLSFDGPASAGFFALNTLTSLAFSVSFTTGEVFSLGDLATPTADAGIAVTDLGGGDFSLVFTGDGSSSPSIGSADFSGLSGALSHEPTAGITSAVGCCGGTGIINLYFLNNLNVSIRGSYSGVARAVSVAEPGGLLLFAMGLLGMAGVARRRRPR